MKARHISLRKSGSERAAIFKKFLAAFLLVSLLSVMLPVYAQAQPGQVIVNQLGVQEQPGRQDLKLYFTVLDTQQKVVPDPKITPNTLALDINGQKVDPATLVVDTPSSPLYIVFLLDASGPNFSNGNNMKTGVKKAMESIEQSSKNTTFAVAMFNDQITTLTSGFTNSATAGAAVDRIKEFKGSNCLFNATYDAQNLFRPLDPTSRRALVLVTGSKDMSNFNFSKPCSQTNTAQTVIKQATTLPLTVPIYVVGFRRTNYQGFDDATVQVLTGITQETGGTVSIGAPNTAEALFQSVANAFINQRIVTTSICIAQNPANKATLSMSVNGTPLTSSPVPFITTVDCSLTAPTNTPAPFGFTLSPGTYSLEKETFSFRIIRQGDADVAKYHIFTKYKETNTQLPGEAGDFFVDATADAQGVTVVTFSTKEARPEPFVVTVEAVDKNNGTIGTPVVQEYGFLRPTATPSPTVAPTTTPVAPSADMLGIRLDNDTREIVLNLRTANLDSVTGYTIRIIDKNNLVAYEKTFNDKPSSEVRIPANSIPGGEYTFVIDLAVPGMATPPSFTRAITYTPPPAPPKPIWEQMGFPMLCALVVIVAICIFGAVWLLLARRPRSPHLPKMPPPPPSGSPRAGGGSKVQADSASDSPANATVFQNSKVPPALLEVVRSPAAQAGTQVEINTVPYWLGRDIGTNDGLTIADNGISRLHAYITFENGEYYINGSKTINGTRVNEEPLGTYDTEGWKGGKISLTRAYITTSQPVQIALGNETIVQFRLKNDQPPSGKPKPKASASAPSDEGTYVLPKAQKNTPGDTSSGGKTDVSRPTNQAPVQEDKTYELPKAKKTGGSASSTAASPTTPKTSVPDIWTAQLQIVSVAPVGGGEVPDLPVLLDVDSTPYIIGSSGDSQIPSAELAPEHLVLTFADDKFHLKLKDKENRTSINGLMVTPSQDLIVEPNTRYTIKVGSKTTINFYVGNGKISTSTIYTG